MNIPKLNIEYTKLDPDARERYVEGMIKETIMLNKDGVSVPQLLEALPFSRKVIEKHLERLVAVNEAYLKEYGRTKVYFPNSRAIHPLAELEVKVGGKSFRSVLIDNMLGKFVYIQEYETGVYGKEVKGGLMVPTSAFKQFVDFISTVERNIGETKDEH